MEDITDSIIFSRGNKFPESYRKNFIGQVWVNNLVEQNNEWNCTIGNVTFEPRCRNNWHKHPGGQILLVTGGRGWFQEWGKDVQEIRPGDVVKISANKKHWHGAARDSWPYIFILQRIRTGVLQNGWNQYQMNITIN